MGKFTFSPEMTRRCTDVSASKFSKTCKTMNSVSLTYLSKQIIISVDKDMEKSEPSYLADGNVKCAAISGNSLAVLSLSFFFPRNKAFVYLYQLERERATHSSIDAWKIPWT